MQNVSRETLELYVELLLKWQQKINLISGDTIDNIWQRHIEDSLQLAEYITPANTIIDIGSGAGLPGIPLAVTTKIKTFLIESDVRKSIFLQEAVRQLKIDAYVMNSRIESAQLPNIKQPVAITARALASVEKILPLIHSLLVKNNLQEYKILLLKGKNVSRETLEVEVNWLFDVEYVKSKTDADASIMIITKLKPR